MPRDGAVLVIQARKPKRKQTATERKCKCANSGKVTIHPSHPSRVSSLREFRIVLKACFSMKQLPVKSKKVAIYPSVPSQHQRTTEKAFRVRAESSSSLKQVLAKNKKVAKHPSLPSHFSQKSLRRT